jgi:hypothetical protein
VVYAMGGPLVGFMTWQECDWSCGELRDYPLKEEKQPQNGRDQPSRKVLSFEKDI